MPLVGRKNPPARRRACKHSGLAMGRRKRSCRGLQERAENFIAPFQSLSDPVKTHRLLPRRSPPPTEQVQCFAPQGSHITAMHHIHTFAQGRPSRGEMEGNPFVTLIK